MLDPAVLCDLNTELFEVINHLFKGILGLSFEVFKVDEYSKFAGLTAESGQQLKLNWTYLVPIHRH